MTDETERLRAELADAWARLVRLRTALVQIARSRTDLSGDYSMGSRQSDIARAALADGKDAAIEQPP